MPSRSNCSTSAITLVHTAGKADYVRSDVVDQHGAVNAAGVHEFEEGLGGAAELHDLIEIGALFLDQLQRMRLEHLHRLDVDVAISDHESVRSSL
jgi:hypothetical protein